MSDDNPLNRKTVGEIVDKYRELTTGARAPLPIDTYKQMAAWLYDIEPENVSDLMRHRVKSLMYFIAYAGE